MHSCIQRCIHDVFTMPMSTQGRGIKHGICLLLTCISGCTNLFSPPLPRTMLLLRVALAVLTLACGFVVTLPGIAAIIGLCFVVAFGASAVAFRYFGGRGKEPAQQYELVSRDDYVDFDNGPRDSFNPFGR